MAVFEKGPYVKMAAFCEKVLHEQDGVLSLIRVIDRVTHTRTGPEAPPTLPPLSYPLVLVLSLVAGEARGSYEVMIEIENPAGLKNKLPPARLFLEGGERGANFVAQLQLTFEHEGLYWFDILFAGQLLTRLPFRVIYSRMG